VYTTSGGELVASGGKALHIVAESVAGEGLAKKPNFIVVLLLLFSAFPYFVIISPDSAGIVSPLFSADLQIYSLVFAFLYVIFDAKLPKSKIIDFWIIYLLSVALVMVVTDWASYYHSSFSPVMREAYAYIAFLLFSIAGLHLRAHVCPIWIYRFLLVCYIIWIAVGLIQTVFPTFLIGTTNRVILGGMRGVTSLAPEPAWFTLQLTLISLCLTIVSKTRWHIFTTLLAGLLLSQSLAGIIAAFTVYGFLYIHRSTQFLRKPKQAITIIGAFAATIIVALLFSRLVPDSRFSMLLSSLMRDPLGLLMTDGSFATRVAEFAGTIAISINNFFIPQSVSAWPSNFSEFLSRNDELFRLTARAWLIEGRHRYSIPAPFGQIIYQLGILSFPLFAVLFRFSKKSSSADLNFTGALFGLLIFVNNANPMFGIFVGFLMAQQLSQSSRDLAF